MNGWMRVGLTGSLVYAAWTVWSCPCERACACKLGTFMLTAGVPVLVVAADNMGRE